MKKRILASLMAMALTATTIVGCGSSAGTTSTPSQGGAETSTQTASAGDDQSEEVELVMYVVSDRPAGQDVVDENLNKLLKEKLNCTLKINWIGWAEYQNKYPMLYSSGESFDLAYCATWLNFANLARRGAFMDLTDLLPEYAPDNYALQSDSALARLQ